MRKKKWKYTWTIPVFLFLLAAICLFTVVLKSTQATLTTLLPQTLTGEYSWDEKTWYPLDGTADLDAQKGDLFLRGHLSDGVVPGGRLYYYQNHIGVITSCNGEVLNYDTVSMYAEEGFALEPSVCGSQWDYLLSPGITPEDEVEFHLHNPHSHGNSSAYRDFLGTLYGSPNTSYILDSNLKPYSFPLQVLGIALMIAALMLLGASLSSALLRIPLGGSLWKCGSLTLFMGGFLILDTIGISFISDKVVFNTYGRQLCMMLAVYCMGLCVCDALAGRLRKIAGAAMLLSSLWDGILIVLSFTGVTVIYDTGFYWAASQAVLCPLLIICAAIELYYQEVKNHFFLLSNIALLTAVLADLAGVGQSIYSHGTCTKVVFVLLFVLYAVDTAKNIVVDHRASIRAKQMEQELEDSRIAITLSQIQPHFLHNALNSISQLCVRDPMEAQQALDDFSIYLRGNMDSLTSSELLYFPNELRHVQTYLKLEKLRFREKLQIRYEIEEEDFFLPSLVVQPLVENAVRHGIRKSGRPGTVTVRTWREGELVKIAVADDGVGFDPHQMIRDGKSHLGIENVRFRLRQMAGGKLTIESAPGKGTTATITLNQRWKEGRHEHLGGR